MSKSESISGPLLCGKALDMKLGGSSVFKASTG